MEDGPPIFRQDFSCPALLFASLVLRVSFCIRGYHPLWPAFPCCSAKSPAITCRLFRFRSPLLSESRLMSFPRATEMFQFTRFASHTYVFSVRYLSVGFPIQKSPDRRLLASPRGLSQLTTSFIACLRQGIHTHALSSLTIKSASNTNFKVDFFSCAAPAKNGRLLQPELYSPD